VRLEPDEAVLARLLEDLVEDLQQLAVGRLRERAGLEQPEQSAERTLITAAGLPITIAPAHPEPAPPMIRNSFTKLHQHGELARGA
jgi:hypothetical protein